MGSPSAVRCSRVDEGPPNRISAALPWWKTRGERKSTGRAHEVVGILLPTAKHAVHRPPDPRAVEPRETDMTRDV